MNKLQNSNKMSNLKPFEIASLLELTRGRINELLTTKEDDYFNNKEYYNSKLYHYCKIYKNLQKELKNE